MFDVRVHFLDGSVECIDVKPDSYIKDIRQTIAKRRNLTWWHEVALAQAEKRLDDNDYIEVEVSVKATAVLRVNLLGSDCSLAEVLKPSQHWSGSRFRGVLLQDLTSEESIEPVPVVLDAIIGLSIDKVVYSLRALDVEERHNNTGSHEGVFQLLEAHPDFAQQHKALLAGVMRQNFLAHWSLDWVRSLCLLLEGPHSKEYAHRLADLIEHSDDYKWPLLYGQELVETLKMCGCEGCMLQTDYQQSLTELAYRCIEDIGKSDERYLILGFEIMALVGSVGDLGRLEETIAIRILGREESLLSFALHEKTSGLWCPEWKVSRPFNLQRCLRCLENYGNGAIAEDIAVQALDADLGTWVMSVHTEDRLRNWTKELFASASKLKHTSDEKICAAILIFGQVCDPSELHELNPDSDDAASPLQRWLARQMQDEYWSSKLSEILEKARQLCLERAQPRASPPDPCATVQFLPQKVREVIEDAKQTLRHRHRHLLQQAATASDHDQDGDTDDGRDESWEANEAADQGNATHVDFEATDAAQEEERDLSMAIEESFEEANQAALDIGFKLDHQVTFHRECLDRKKVPMQKFAVKRGGLRELEQILNDATEFEAARAAVLESGCALRPDWACGAWIFHPVLSRDELPEDLHLDKHMVLVHAVHADNFYSLLQAALARLPKAVRPKVRQETSQKPCEGEDDSSEAADDASSELSIERTFVNYKLRQWQELTPEDGMAHSEPAPKRRDL